MPMDKLAAQIINEYNEITDTLINKELLIDSNYLVPIVTREKTILSWSNGGHLSYLFGEYSSIDHYLAILNQRDFSFCFSDGALVQIRYDVIERSITGHRLCYFPCPFHFSPDERQDFSLSDIPVLFSADEIRSRFKLVSPIRFDFDENFSDERHSNSHVSINKNSFRLPAYGPISLGHFFRFILRYFYEDAFPCAVGLEDLRFRLYARTLPIPSPHEFHLETSSTY